MKMKLVFERNDDKSISVKILTETELNDFSYINFINRLFENELLEDPKFPDDISVEEKTKILELVEKINQAVVRRT